MEGKSIPKIAPEHILYVGKEKWKIIVYENSPRMGTEADNLTDIKNRVTVAINANNDAHLSRPKCLDVLLYLILI